MAVRPIIYYPDERLRQVSSPVTDFYAARSVALDMIETLEAAPNGIALAAPQVGEPIRMFVLQIAKYSQPQVFVNPEITAHKSWALFEEGCLSFPGEFVKVMRAERVTINALGVDGASFEVTLNGYEAVAAQHEYDHLDGKLMIDYAPAQLRRKLVKKMRGKR